MKDVFLIVCADRHEQFIVDRLERNDTGAPWVRTRPDGGQPLFAGDTPVNPGKVWDDGIETLSTPDRWRDNFYCKSCRKTVPGRDEKWQRVVSAVFAAGKPDITLDGLQLALNFKPR